MCNNFFVIEDMKLSDFPIDFRLRIFENTFIFSPNKEEFSELANRGHIRSLGSVFEQVLSANADSQLGEDNNWIIYTDKTPRLSF